jgi:rhamnosyl/mannosyltransferase
VDKIVCTSPNYLATSPVLTRYADKVKVIPIGIDERSYPQPDARTMEEVERDFGRDFFLFVGVLRYYKGLHVLLDALVDKSYPVLIVGSGPTEQVLKRQAKRLNLRHVTFTGRVSDVVKVALLRLCKGVVFPSHLRSEAFGVTLLEGAMCSKPLISTEVGTGTSHVNQQNRTGLVVQPGSPQALADALDTLNGDPVLVAKMGEAARDRYQGYFTGTVMGERYMELYRSLTGSAIVEEKDAEFTAGGPSRTDRRSRPLLHTESEARRVE